jgi:tyrosinase
MTDAGLSRLNRRGFLAGAAALLGAGAAPSGVSAQQGARFRRFEINDPAMPARVLQSYKTGISKMLNLPATDPRNWYRNAMVHVLDCPHANWWFLVWHRAYLGWFEKTIRDLSGDNQFALPYWDWTAAPRVPDAMFDGVLDPNNGAFCPTFDCFNGQFQAAVSLMYGSFSQTQNDALALRNVFVNGNPFPVTTPAQFWSIAQQIFVDQPNARGLTATNPTLDGDTQVAVSIGTIRRALRTRLFAGSGDLAQPAGFQSAKAANHSEGSTEGILESQPHDNVHGAMGGGGAAMMTAFLSPIDPIFFLHHANLDRLWDVWTRKQAAAGLPALPQGQDLAAWSGEQFLFFSDSGGQPVSTINAGDYQAMSVFDYDYAPGSGEGEVQVPAVAAAHPQAFHGQIAAETIGARQAAGGRVQVPAAALAAAKAAAISPVAQITLNLGHADQGRRFRVLVSAGGGATPVAAGAITVFGHAHGPRTFSVPLPEDLGPAFAAGDVPLDIRVVPIGVPSGPAAAEAIATPPRVSAIKVTTN